MITLTIPRPPSLNGIYANRSGGRLKTSEYKKWREVAAWEIKAQRPKPFIGNITVSLEVGKPRRGDIDNRIKPVLDALQEAGVIENDSKVDKITAWWGIETRVTVRTA